MSQDQNQHLEIKFDIIEFDTFWNLLKSSCNLFFSNIVLISKIVLIVYVPVELIKNIIIYSFGIQEDIHIIIRLNMIIEAVVGSLISPAIIYAVVTLLNTGEIPSISESYKWGIKRWTKVFINRWIAGFIVIAGLFLFIIPGIILITWYLLIDAVVAIEGDKQQHVLTRSREITKGYRPLLFLAAFTLFIIFILISYIAGAITSIIDHSIINFIIDNIINVLHQIFTIMLLLAYLRFSSLLDKKTEVESNVKVTIEPKAKVKTESKPKVKSEAKKKAKTKVKAKTKKQKK